MCVLFCCSKKKPQDNYSESTTNCTESWAKKKRKKGNAKKSIYFPADNSSSTFPAKKQAKKSAVSDKTIDKDTDNHTMPHCPWGGRVGSVELVNTCSIDNLLFLTHRLIVDRSEVKAWLQNSPEIISKTMLVVSQLFSKGNWAAGKLCWITATNGCDTTNLCRIDMFGSEHDKFVKHFGNLQSFVCTQVCSKLTCKFNKQCVATEILLQ